ncbi:MAG: hypothetical protein V2G42_06945 [bacterium JZ-2024 1]
MRQIARDRVRLSAGYDPALVTNGDTANAISPFVPAPIRTRAQSASTRARTTAILRHPALGDPTASPLATPVTGMKGIRGWFSM